MQIKVCTEAPGLAILPPFVVVVRTSGLSRRRIHRSMNRAPGLRSVRVLDPQRGALPFSSIDDLILLAIATEARSGEGLRLLLPMLVLILNDARAQRSL